MQSADRDRQCRHCQHVILYPRRRVEPTRLAERLAWEEVLRCSSPPRLISISR